MDRPLSTAEVARLLGLDERRVSEWARADLCLTRRRSGRYSFTFQDLVALRAAQALLEAGVPSARIRRVVAALARDQAAGRPLSGLRIFADGRDVAVCMAGERWQPATGQTLFEFEVDQLAQLVEQKRPTLALPLGDPVSEARPAFEEALGLEYRDAGAAGAAYARALAHDPALSEGGLNLTLRTIYDAFGRVTQSVDATGKITTTSYQDSGRTIVVTDPLNRSLRSEYDAFGVVLKVTNVLEQTTTSYEYDSANRQMKVTTPEGIEVRTRRTRHGEVLSLQDGRGNSVAYSYNKDGQLVSMTDTLGQPVLANDYDDSGRLFETTDARGTVTRLSYDQLNRVIERRVDPNGLNLKTRYRFDALGRQIEVTEGADSSAQRVRSYEYDRKGQLTRVTVDPTGLKLTTDYRYVGVGQTLKVAQGNRTIVTASVTAVKPSENVTGIL